MDIPLRFTAGDTIPHVLRSLFPPIKDTFLTNRQFIIILCTTFISYPLSLYRDISKLARASAFALLGMVIIVVSVIVKSERVAPELRGDPNARFTFVNQGIFQAIGVISFAFVCHHNSLLIYGDLRTPTLDRFALVTHISTVISFVSCLTLAVVGYVVFTDKTQGNILNNFPEDDLLINVARFCFGFNMFTTLPLELFVCREVRVAIVCDFYGAKGRVGPRDTGDRAVFLFARAMEQAAACAIHDCHTVLLHVQYVSFPAQRDSMASEARTLTRSTQSSLADYL